MCELLPKEDTVEGLTEILKTVAQDDAWRYLEYIPDKEVQERVRKIFVFLSKCQVIMIDEAIG